MQKIASLFDYPFYTPNVFEETKKTRTYSQIIFDTFINAPLAAFDKFKAKFEIHNESCEKLLRDLGSSSGDANKILFVQALTSANFHILRPGLKKIFSSLDMATQDEYLQTIVKESVHLKKNELISKCLHLLTEADLKKLVEFKWCNNEKPQYSQLIKNYMDCYEINAKYRPYDPTIAFLKSEIKALIPQVINFLLSIFDTLIVTIQFFEIGESPKSSWEASNQLDVYQKILSIPLSILWVLNAYFPNPIICGTAFLLTIVALGLAIYSYKWLKPVPIKLSKTINLTDLATQGKIPQVIGRGVEITKVMNCLIQNLNSNVKEHVLLVGDSGVGKTTIIEGLALKIASGNVPDELKGVKVFITNAAKINQKNYMAEKSPLEEIIKKMRDHKGKILLVVDEIHEFMQGDASLRNEFLSLLDSSCQSIPLFIGITSSYQYNKHSEVFKEPALARRLKSVIEIKETDKNQTITILKSMLQLYYPEISDMSEEICEKIYALSDGNHKSLEPLNSKGLLSILAENIRSGLKGNHLKEALDALNAELQRLELPKVGPISPEKIFTPLNDLKGLKEKILKKENEIKEHNKIVDSYKSLKNQRRKREVFLNQLAKKINASDINLKPTDKLTHHFLFESLYLIPAMEKELNDFAFLHNLKVEITEELIDKTFPENSNYASMTGSNGMKKERTFVGNYSRKHAPVYAKT
jgi:DNA replication protein DnaC